MIFIAVRHLLARKKQTTFTLLGIALGSMAYIIISGVMLGFRFYLIDQLINNDAHVRISAPVRIVEPEEIQETLFHDNEVPVWRSPPSGRKDNARLEDQSAWLEILRNDSDVSAFAPQLVSRAIFINGKAVESGRIIGILPKEQARVSTLAEYMVEGNFQDISEGGNRIILGFGLKRLLGAKVQDTIFLTDGKGGKIPFKIIGTFQIGNKMVDDATAYARLSSVQSLSKTPNRISDIVVRLFDVELADSKSAEWSLRKTAKVQSWKETNASFFTVFQVQDMIRYSVVSTILIVAGFGIYNILSIVISQKKKEIAILRSMGYEPSDIMQIFFYQGAILGFIGGLFGLILGYFACTRLELIQFTNPMMRLKGGNFLVSFHYSIYLISFVLAFIATIVASIFPARAASKLSPIDTIRGE